MPLPPARLPHPSSRPCAFQADALTPRIEGAYPARIELAATILETAASPFGFGYRSNLIRCLLFDNRITAIPLEEIAVLSPGTASPDLLGGDVSSFPFSRLRLLSLAVSQCLRVGWAGHHPRRSPQGFACVDSMFVRCSRSRR